MSEGLREAVNIESKNIVVTSNCVFAGLLFFVLVCLFDLRKSHMAQTGFELALSLECWR